MGEIKEKKNISFEFFYDNQNYKLTIEKIKYNKFIFDIILQMKQYRFWNTKIEQNQIQIHEKMNYFIEALETINEDDQLEILFNESIELYSKKTSFEFLINIFIKVYNTQLCSNILNEFSKNKENPSQKNNIISDSLLKFNDIFINICENSEKVIEKYSVNEIDFYGLVLTYLNNYNEIKFKEKFNELYKKSKNILFDVMLKYKFYFKKQKNIDVDFLEEIIKYATNKDFKELKESVFFYLKDIESFLDIIYKNKDEIIEKTDFEPIEVITIEDIEKINITEIIEKIDHILKFEESKNILLINFKPEFWEILAKKCSTTSRENIELCFKVRKKLVEYKNIIYKLFDDETNSIRKEISIFYKRGRFISLLDKMIKEYINTNLNITNIEIIELIKLYNIYYSDKRYIRRREPDFLKKIDLEKIDDDFKKIYQQMKFEEIFEQDLNNYILILLNKIQKITDFDIIFELININNLGDNKNTYLNMLKKKYELVINEIKSSDNFEKIINSLVNLTYFMCINEDNNNFLSKTIINSEKIDGEMKHKICLQLIKLCDEKSKDKKQELTQSTTNVQIKKFISDKYFDSLRNLKLDDLRKFIEFLMNLSQEDANDFIENLKEKYSISNIEFYSIGNSFNIQLLSSIIKKINVIKDNEYITSNIKVLKRIYEEIVSKEIKYEYLQNFSQDKKEIVLEKLNILALLPESDINPEDYYDKISRYYNEMKETYNKLSNYKASLELYHQDIKNEEILKVSKYIEMIKEGTYNSYYKHRANIQVLLDETKNIVEKVNDIKNSKIFRIFFSFYNKKEKKKDDKSPFDQAYDEFKKFKEELSEKGANFINKKSNKNSIIKKIIEENNENPEIQKELSSLFNEKIKGDEEFNLFLNSKIYEKDFNSMFAFLEYFEKNIDEITNWKKICKKFSKKEDNLEMKNILQKLKEEGLYDYTKENHIYKKSNYIQMFNLFFDKKQALDFLNKEKTEDIKHLYDKIEPNNGTISTKEISDTINCIGFFQQLKGKKNLKEIISYIKSKMDEKDLFTCFINFSKNYRSIIELDKNFDYSLNIVEKIKEIINDAKFYFNKNNDEFKYRNNEKMEYNIITIDKIRELNNKIQIRQEKNSSNVSDDNSKKLYEKYQKLIFFKNLSNKVEEIYNYMTILRTKGSTLPISIRVEINYPEVKYFLGTNKQAKEFKDVKDFLSKAKINIIKQLDLYYKKLTTIRFIYGKQIDILLSHIQGNYPIDSFLRYILNITDCENKIEEGKRSFQRNVNDYVNEIVLYNKNSFEIIHNYIVSLFEENNLSIEQYYKNISIKKCYSIKGLYKYLSQSETMEEDILQIFLEKIGKIPIAQNILINNKETSYEEMQAFFSRAILCKYNTLFVVKVNNSFSDYQQKCMNIFINNYLSYKNILFNQNEENKEAEKNDTSTYMNSCLVFIYNKDSESFLSELNYLNPKNLPMDHTNHSLKREFSSDILSTVSSFNDPLREKLFSNTHIIKSEICGLGKSTKIKNKIKESGKEYIYFPLGGQMTRNIIYHKLEEIMRNLPKNKKSEDIAIHLDLFESKDLSVLNEFLFSFLITKFYSNNENIIYIPVNIEIYIEIPNCFNDFAVNYEILKLFEKDDDIIKADHIPELNLSSDKIRLLKNMLGIDGNKEIHNWVKSYMKKLNIPKYSYHQIHIFINLFIAQYNKFKGTKLIFLGKNNEDVTKKCIDEFACGTKYFIYGGFSKLLLQEQKMDTSKHIEDIDILSQEYDNDLKNEQFKEKLIFIIKNKKQYYDLDISTSSLKSGKSLTELLYVKNKEDIIKEKKNKYGMVNFEKYKYLYILKSILDLKNPVEPNKNERLTSLIEIIEKDDYIITIDNFRKMILILYRIIANIPVILMGETGCGKTHLIKKLNQLLNSGKESLEILNIDPSYTNDKLKDKMYSINKNAKKAKTEGINEYWVFFDELNTCDSLALITEIFINRTYNGVKLEENIRLIGACNPYRRKKENKYICGLTYPNNNNELVYLVNILPQSLMYYVFNFGRLERENEEQYISSIITDIVPDKELNNLTKNVISQCHVYLRKTFDDSVVSLREMKRFKIIYKFFLEYYKNKCECLGLSRNKQSEILKSIIISIYLCYYIRLVDGKTRSNFDSEMKQELKKLVNYKFNTNQKDNNFHENDIIYNGELKNDLQNNYKITDLNNFNFSQILSEEEDFIINNIKLDRGIGKNKSLKENIFLLFVSLVTHIPLIIIGKPGSSKSLSAQLINREMAGEYSREAFFKYYPSIIQNYFQGSDSTTPGDVEGIFKIAKGRLKELKKKDENMPISMILFDELGLAERSKHNPLKVLHSHLELDGNKDGISFVGISNWTLDAAKINRALTLSVPDLDDNLEDLKDTAKSIVKSINEDFITKPIFNKILPNVYFYFKTNLKILKKLTVYKQYELQQYKNALNKYKNDKDFEKIFSSFEDWKSFFENEKSEKVKSEKEKSEKEKSETSEVNNLKIFEYHTYKKVKKQIKEFLENEEKKEYSEEIEIKDVDDLYSLNNKKTKNIKKSPFNQHNFKKLYEKDKTIKEDFLGNRDFYYLIKGIANEMNENNNNNLKLLIKKYIERNFGGLEIIIDYEKDYNELIQFEHLQSQEFEDFLDIISKKKKWHSAQIFKIIYNIYCKYNKEYDKIIEDSDIDDYNYIQNIFDNLRDSKSRYLLLEIKPSLASLIHKKLSKKLNKTIYFIEGSPFANDNSSEYQFDIIGQIQKHAEKDHCIILHNLNQIYAFLYDLFNKNFIKKDGKNYARICHGNYSEQLTHINEEFRVIIMVNKKYLDQVEPPFLNRFEKMNLSFKKLISEKQKNCADTILAQLDIKQCISRLNYDINYELKDLLIGCKKEDIKGMIYYELDIDENQNGNDEEEKEEKIKNTIFDKIYKLLPQDIIVNLGSDNILRKKYDSFKQYYNLESYLNSEIKHKISIIYTFHSKTVIINCIDESSMFKMISEIKSERELKYLLDAKIEENDKTIKNKNLLFIHFDESNSKKLGFFISFIMNNYYERQELKFIFIVHIKRNFLIYEKKDKKVDKIYAVPDMDSNIYQLFIDNLNGPEIELKDIISDPIKQITDKGLLSSVEEFKKAINKFTNLNLKKLNGKNNIINYDNYSEKLEKYFEDNSPFMNDIFKKINTYTSQQKDKSNNIIEKIYNAKYINKSSVDLISVIIEFVKNEILSKYINIILCYLEDKNILTSLIVFSNDKTLFNETLNDSISRMLQQYLNNINIEDNNKYNPKFNLNYIVPGLYDFYKNLSDFIDQNIRNIFVKNEKKIRSFLPGEKNDKNDAIEKYYKNEQNLLNLTYNEITKDKFIFKFIEEIPSDLLLKDFITYNFPESKLEEEIGISLNSHDLTYNDYIHKLINLILDLRFDKKKKIVKNNNDSLKLLLIKINWLIANKDYIIQLLQIYVILANNFKENELIQTIENISKNKNIRYITNNKKNPEITTEVNESYYKIIASICYSIIPPNIDFGRIIKSNDYINSLKNSMKIIKNLNDNLYIYSIEVILLEELIQIYDVLELNHKLDKKILNNICMNLKENNDIFCSNFEEIKSEVLKDKLKNLFNIFETVFKEDDKNYLELLKFICFKETKKVPNVDYRTCIFQEVIKYKEIIINSNDILQILLFPLVNPNISKFPKSIVEILNANDYDIAAIIENIISNDKDEICNVLSETLLYHFEENSLMYFNNLFYGKEKISIENDEEKPNIGPLKLFKDCLKFLNKLNKESKKYEGKNKNISKLFCIGYIKAYCYTFINLLDTCNLESDNNLKIKKIIDAVNNGINLNKIISFYIWKIIYYKNKKNFDVFIDPECLEKYELNYYKCFKNIEICENPLAYNYMNKAAKEIYEQFNDSLVKFKDNEYEDVKIEVFNPNKIDIDIFYFSTSNLILSRLMNKKFIDSPIYNNFFKNVCIPLFKKKEKIFNAIKILYDPQKCKNLIVNLGLNRNNLNVILHSYRYFINEINSNSNNKIYSAFYDRSVFINKINKINKAFYPGNDIKDIPIYSIYSKILEHFQDRPNQGCFVCLCKNGGYYHSIQGGNPGSKYLNLKCKNCGDSIGVMKNQTGNIVPIKRENYYRIYQTKEESYEQIMRDSESYNCMSLDEFREKYILNEFQKEKGISKSDEKFFMKNKKIVRFLSSISYRILNFILYSHLFFSKLYNNNEELNVFLPNNMDWIKVLTEGWEMIKIELNKKGINSIDMFMNYIFSDLFSSLNGHNSINNYDELIKLENQLDKLIQNKIIGYKKDYKSFNNTIELDTKDKTNKYLFQYFVQEKNFEVNKNDFPFYNYFYYSDYINEDYLLKKLNYIEKDKYPVLLKVLEKKKSKNNKKQYSLDKLPIFNEVLNLFNEKYSYSIKRDKANKLLLKDIKDQEIYINNKSSIHNFMKFYNNLKITNEQNNVMKLSEESTLSEFFIDDSNDIGKSYKFIYNQFINEQNNEISDLLENKIEKGIFERNCKTKIEIQSANKNEVFITNLPETFSFVEVVLYSSYRKFAITNDYSTYNHFEINFDLIEDRMTELLLRNKKLFKNSIINFVYANEELVFDNKDIITKFNNEYEIEKINIGDKKILYRFYQENKENENLFKTIFNDFIQLIIFLNRNKKLIKEKQKNAIYIKDKSKIYETFEYIGTKVSESFKALFMEKDTLLISKVTDLFDYYRALIFNRIKLEIKNYQYEIEEEKKNLIENCFKDQHLITKDVFKSAIRAFIVLFLNLEKDKENNVKRNQNNIINYFDIPDIWDKTVYNNNDFPKELNNLKKANVNINQILSLYDYLGDDINDNYFLDVQKAIEKEEEIKNAQKMQEPFEKEEEAEEEKLSEKVDSASDDDFERKSDDEYGPGERDYV